MKPMHRGAAPDRDPPESHERTTMMTQLTTTTDLLTLLQDALEEHVPAATGNAVYLNGTDDLVMFHGEGVELHLTNGASFQLQVIQAAEADDELDGDDIEELLMLNPDGAIDPAEAEEAQLELADAVEAYGIDGDHGPHAEGLAKDIEAIADTLRGLFPNR